MNKPAEGRVDAHRLDLHRVADESATLEGAWPLSALSRLMQDAGPAGDGQVHWSVRGERRTPPGGRPEPWLHLTAEATVRLDCQRCLQPVDETLAVARSFRFVADEATAEREDEQAEEDVLALPPRGRLDLQPLVEDELILALPIVPRHAECPAPPPLQAADPGAAEEAPKVNPFAALAALKRRS